MSRRSLVDYDGAVVTTKDPADRTRTTETDALGRIKTASSGGLISASYEYNVFDQLTKVTQGGQIRNYEYL